ncbi:MAG: hypothetical protein ABIV25_07745 [Paracoccaceae bacterium]
MKRFLSAPALLAPALLALASCGTPQEQCIRLVSHDLLVVDRLIADAQTNLSRGYGIESEQITTPRLYNCTDAPTEADPNPMRQMCSGDYTQTISRPVAIDLAAEQVKLRQLQVKRAQLSAASAPAVAQCQAQYPE